VEEIPQQEIQNETVSSTRIRRALKEGNIQRANAYLEHHYMICAKMEALPDQHGRPCFKIPVSDPLKLVPVAGGYAASFYFNGQYEKALVHVEEDSALLFPLDAGTIPGPGEESVRFHKRLASKPDPDFISMFNEVQELIY